MPSNIDCNPDLVKTWDNVLDEDELEFWAHHMSHPDFWQEIRNSDHIEGQPHHYTFKQSYWEDNKLKLPYKYINKRKHKYVERYFGDDFLLKPQPAFRKWVKGTHMGGHGDGFKRDNVLDFQRLDFAETAFLPRGLFEVATVLYYNDDFEGGNLVFRNLGIEIEPRAGMLAAFPCSYAYEHSVTEITRGERLTSATHWIKCSTMARVLSHEAIPEGWWREYENSEVVYEMLGMPDPKAANMPDHE